MQIASQRLPRAGAAVVGLVLLAMGPPARGADKAAKPAKAAAPAAKITGRWNLTVTGPDGVTYPSWVEITPHGDGLAGRICGRFGSAHPLDRVEWNGKELVLAEGVKNGEAKSERLYRARLQGGRLEGEITFEGEAPQKLVAARAPDLKAPARPKWSKPINLITQGLAGWRLRNDKHPGCWGVTDGVLTNRKPCVDIISDGKYQNFKLHLEFKLGEPRANSGVYLRGRYEVQINDDAGKAPESHGMGSVYGLLTPRSNPSKPAGEWQSYDITLLGRRLTVVLNGETIIDNEEIPGPTGGALDSDEARAGPLMLQGDHGVVSFRNITITPAL
jgi:hypothetical protein